MLCSRLPSNFAGWRPQVLVYLAGSGGAYAPPHRDALFFRLCGISHQIGLPLSHPAMQHNLLQQHRRVPPANLAIPLSNPRPPASSATSPCSATRASTRLAVGTSTSPPPRSPAPASLSHPQALVPSSPSVSAPRFRPRIGAATTGAPYSPASPTATPNYALALCGAAEEAEASAFVAAGLERSVLPSRPLSSISAANSPPPRDRRCLRPIHPLSRHDSGPMHLAAAVQTPCIAIFSARNLPRMWFPYGDPAPRPLPPPPACAGCGLETCLFEQRRCLTAISVAEVLAQVEQGPLPSPRPLQLARCSHASPLSLRRCDDRNALGTMFSRISNHPMLPELASILNLLEGGFAPLQILVLGDLMLDRYILGEVDRISPRRPSPSSATPSATSVPVAPPTLP